MKKLAKVLLVLVLILAIAAAGVFFGYRYLNQDMTGVPYDEIKDFMEVKLWKTQTIHIIHR